MNPKDFVIWLNGFISGCHSYNATPEQWDTLKDVLSKVKLEEKNPFVASYTVTTTKDLLHD